MHYEFYNLSFKIYENDFTIKNDIIGLPLNDIFFCKYFTERIWARSCVETDRSVFIISHVIRYGFKDTDVCSHMEGEDVVDYKLFNR